MPTEPEGHKTSGKKGRKIGIGRVVLICCLVWLVVVLLERPADPEIAGKGLVGFILLGVLIYALYRGLQSIYNWTTMRKQR
jgi:hypothetical protein